MRWVAASVPSLRLRLAPAVRTSLAAWLAASGELNGFVGLARGPLETRLNHLRQLMGSTTVLAWASADRWAAGAPHVFVDVPELGLEFDCTLAPGRLTVLAMGPTTPETELPEHPGVRLEVARVLLPSAAAPHDSDAGDPGVAVLAAQLGCEIARWTELVPRLRKLVAAEAELEESRATWLRSTFAAAEPEPGYAVWQLSGAAERVVRALSPGEWLEVRNRDARPVGSVRVLEAMPPDLVRVEALTADVPAHGGSLAPRPSSRLLAQKHGLLDELAQPTGNLPHIARLIADPGSVAVPPACWPREYVNPAVGRVESQAQAVAHALGMHDGQLLVIHGPPGTGKSTTAAEILAQLVRRDPSVRVLVCSHSNHGTDNMLARSVPWLPRASERIARVGFLPRVAPESVPFFCPPDADPWTKNVVFTTVDGLTLQDAAGARLYDYVILDEANRADIVDSLLVLARGRRMLLVGDPMQLQPVSATPVSESLLEWIVGRGLADGCVVLLDEQNRMHPDIARIVSDAFYGGRVQSGPFAPSDALATCEFPDAVTWVDVGGGESRAEGGHSLANFAEATAVAEALDQLACSLPPEATIGVIAAYAEQRRLLRTLIGTPAWGRPRQLAIETVDAFEGRERDVILLSLVRSNPQGDLGFLRTISRLNVAISRARRKLVVFGDGATLREPVFQRVREIARSKVSV